MDYALFGRTGMRVSGLSLGTMTFGQEADEATSAAIMNRAFEAGINVFDTADIYSNGHSEEITGRWLEGRRKAVVLATKVHFPTGEGPNDRGSSRRHILFAVEECLRRLRTDWLDILYLHHWDEDAAIEESLSAITTLAAQGKVLYCGVSNFAAWQTMKALAVSEAGNLARVACVQPLYNLVKRQAEVEILPMAQSEGLAVCPYSPLASGLLTGKYLRGEKGRLDENAMHARRYSEPQYGEIAARFGEYAQANGYSPGALAVAWVMAHPAVTTTLIGARNLAQLEESISATEIRLTPEARAEISALSVEPPLATDREK